MSNRRRGDGWRQLPLRWLETRIVRDIKIPLCEADLEMNDGWGCVAIPPDLDSEWFVVEDRDRKTVWGRWVLLLEDGA
jgi:hypothetical protein